MTDLTSAPDASVGVLDPPHAARRRAGGRRRRNADHRGRPRPRRELAGPLRPGQGERRGLGPPRPAGAARGAQPSSTSGASAPAAGPTRSTRPRSRRARRAGRPCSSGPPTRPTSSPSTSHRPSCGRWRSRRGSSASTRGACWLPQALEGVATVGLVYLSVRRWFSAQAALLGGCRGGAHPRGRHDVPLQQPRRPAGTAAHRGDLRHHARPREGADQVARPRRRADRVRLHHQNDAGLPDPPRHGGRLPAGRADRLVAPGLADLPHGCLRAGGGRLVGGHRRADAGGRPALRRRVAEQQHPQPDLRLQRLRPPRRQRVGQRGRWTCRREHVGPDRLHPPVQRGVREHDVVAAARAPSSWAPCCSSSPSGPAAPIASAPGSCSGAARW